MKVSKNNILLKKTEPWKKKIDSQTIAEHKNAMTFTKMSRTKSV